jgi:hypothetical protein
MRESTILEDGRRVQADECLELEPAMYGPDDVPEVTMHERRSVKGYAIICRCCNGPGEHHWSSSGHSVDPGGGDYSCQPCAGLGEFAVKTP